MPGLKRVSSGKFVGSIAIKVYECNGCGVQHKGIKPAQCYCGRMDFTKYDSIGEANRYADLRLRERAGLISGLRMQVRFELLAFNPCGKPAKVGEYIADSVYFVTETGKQVIEDFKGAIDPLAAWKHRHMAAMGLPVTIVTSEGKQNVRPKTQPAKANRDSRKRDKAGSVAERRARRREC